MAIKRFAKIKKDIFMSEVADYLAINQYKFSFYSFISTTEDVFEIFPENFSNNSYIKIRFLTENVYNPTLHVRERWYYCEFVYGINDMPYRTRCADINELIFYFNNTAKILY